MCEICGASCDLVSYEIDGMEAFECPNCGEVWVKLPQIYIVSLEKGIKIIPVDSVDKFLEVCDALEDPKNPKSIAFIE